MTPEQQSAREAVSRLGDETRTLQIAAAQMAIKALIATHPDPAAVRAVYDQLLGQFMASTSGLPNNSDRMLVLRDISATLFAPPVVLDM